MWLGGEFPDAKGEFPDPSKAISTEQAAKEYIKHRPLELTYTITQVE